MQGQIGFIDTAQHRGALLVRLRTAVQETGLPEPTIRRAVQLRKTGRTNFVSVADLNAHIRRLASDPSEAFAAEAPAHCRPPESVL
jgi:hypothetical protein